MENKRKNKVLVFAVSIVVISITWLTLHAFTSSAQINFQTRAFEVPLFIGGEGAEESKLRHPSGIVVDSENRIYIADTLNHRVQVFDERGELLTVINRGGRPDEDLYLPEDVAISPGGEIYVADTGSDSIQIYEPGGKFVGSIPDANDSSLALDSPGGITFDRKGNLYVVNSASSLVMKFNPQGLLLKIWGGVGSVKGKFVGPSRIAVSPEGNLWITDTGNHRIQVFSADGRYLFQFGRAGSGLGMLKSPVGIALDRDGNAYVADSGNSRIQKFDSQGKPMASIGRQGKELNEFLYPNGLDIDSEGNLYVTDSVAHRIQKLAFNPALVLLEQGRLSFEKKNYEVALSQWNKALEIDPQLAEAMYAVGMLHLKMGRSSIAIKWFKKALEADPSYHEVRSTLKRVYLKIYSPIIIIGGIVLVLLIIYVVRRQNKINDLRTKARLLRKEGKIRDTISVYEELHELDRNNLGICKLLSELYDREGMEEQSRKVNRTIARLEPENVVALSHIGKNQLLGGKFSRAVETWRKVIRISPYSSDAYFFLGVSEAQMDSGESAVKDFLKAFELEGEDPETLVQAARSCMERGEITRAAIKLQSARLKMPDSKKLERMLEEIEDRYFRTLGSTQGESGVSALKAALEAWESELEVCGEFEVARSVFMAAREKAGEELFNRIKSRLETETGETEIRGLERVLELQPDNQEAVQLLKEVKIEIALGNGFNSYKEENYSQAITYFQKVLSLDPEHSEALKYLRYAQQCLEGGFRTRFKHLDL